MLVEDIFVSVFKSMCSNTAEAYQIKKLAFYSQKLKWKPISFA